MFVGHFALGFAAKRAVPRVPLPVLFGAAQLADTLWPILVAVGAEQVRIDPGNTAFTPLDFISYPYSHSLLLLLVWGAAFGGIAARVFRSTTAGVAVCALVVSHWVLDYVTHRPDMPIYPGGQKFGLALWNSVPATLVVELTMFAVGLWSYQRTTRARTRTGRINYVALVATLVVIYIANVAGPPPPSVSAIWIAGVLGAAILIAWAWSVDRQRDVILAAGEEAVL